MGFINYCRLRITIDTYTVRAPVIHSRNMALISLSLEFAGFICPPYSHYGARSITINEIRHNLYAAKETATSPPARTRAADELISAIRRQLFALVMKLL